MKNMKKLAALLLALLLTLTMTSAFADETERGSITINGVSEKTTYEIYRLLDLVSYDTNGGTYSYKVNEDWASFFETDEAKACFEIDADGYPKWIGSEEADVVAKFAKDALAYAKEHQIVPVASTKNSDMEMDGTIGKFEDLTLGYYLIDSTMGALCGLTTTNPNASIQAKNGIPIVDKQVQEDSTNQWGDLNTADIGQTVNFRVTISVHPGAENYVLHDVMSAGLTFDPASVKVYHIVPKSNGEQESHSATLDTDYTVVTEGLEDGCTFEVRFTQDFCDHLETNDKVGVTYSAMLNRHAIIAKDGNPNEAWLEYGEENESNHDITITKSFGIDIVKTDKQHTLIDGAKFKIYDAETNGNEVAVVLLKNDADQYIDENGDPLAEGENPLYRRARADETGVEIEVKDGLVRIVGFDNGTYYLEETQEPNGYNKLTKRQKFIISDANLDAVFNDTVFSGGSGVHVINNSGTMLPETGGIGTTLFYVIGGLLAVAAVVLLVTKKRMNDMD